MIGVLGGNSQDAKKEACRGSKGVSINVIEVAARLL